MNLRRTVALLGIAASVMVCGAGSSGDDSGTADRLHDPKEVDRRLDESIEFLTLVLNERMDHADAARGTKPEVREGALLPGGIRRDPMAPPHRDFRWSVGASELSPKSR